MNKAWQAHPYTYTNYSTLLTLRERDTDDATRAKQKKQNKRNEITARMKLNSPMFNLFPNERVSTMGADLFLCTEDSNSDILDDAFWAAKETSIRDPYNELGLFSLLNTNVSDLKNAVRPTLSWWRFSDDPNLVDEASRMSPEAASRFLSLLTPLVNEFLALCAAGTIVRGSTRGSPPRRVDKSLSPDQILEAQTDARALLAFLQLAIDTKTPIEWSV